MWLNMTVQAFDRTASVKDVILKEPLAQMGKLVLVTFLLLLLFVCLLACLFSFFIGAV